MSKKKRPAKAGIELRVDPEARLTPKFDSVSVAEHPVAERGKMGLRVVDDCAEEHIM